MASAAADQKAGAKASKQQQMPKSQVLDLIASLKKHDDERTSVSKKLSWILRHGYQRLNLEPVKSGGSDDGTWFKVSDLLQVSILEDVKMEKLMSVIEESNAQKLRYELINDNTLIRAFTKADRRAKTPSSGTTSAPPKEAAASAAASEPKGADKGLRGEAPEFVPGQAQPAMPTYDQYAAAAAAFGYPFGMPGYPYPGMMPPMMYPPMAYQQPQPAGQGRFTGKIKSYNAEKGFGFIESTEARNMYGRDVFLHKTRIGDLQVGAEVTFTVETNKQNMPQAKDVQAARGGPGKGPKSGGRAEKGTAKGGKGEKAKGRGRGRGRGEGRGAAKGADGAADRKAVQPGEVNAPEGSAAAAAPAEEAPKPEAKADAPPAEAAS